MIKICYETSNTCLPCMYHREKRERAEPPSFLKKLGDCSVMEGMTAKFTACVAGFPEPTFKWFVKYIFVGNVKFLNYKVRL